MSSIISELLHLDVAVDAGVLAGGRSTRMNGLDKGLQALNNSFLIEPCLDVLLPFAQHNEVMINCNRNAAQYKLLSSRTYEDIFDGFLGPLAGLHSLLSNTQADYLVVSPCDTPFVTPQLPHALLTELLQRLKINPKARPIIAAKYGDKLHPLHLCLPKEALTPLTKVLEAQHSKVIRCLEELNTIWVDVSDTDTRLDNINTLDQLLQAK